MGKCENRCQVCKPNIQYAVGGGDPGKYIGDDTDDEDEDLDDAWMYEQYDRSLTEMASRDCVDEPSPFKSDPTVVPIEEVRVTDPDTGAQKGKKQAQMDALDPKSLLEVAKVAGFGAEKYDRLNFMKGYDWSLSYAALMRHLLAWYSGEDNDPESGLSHLAHACWHSLALLSFSRVAPNKDDRPSRLTNYR